MVIEFQSIGAELLNSLNIDFFLIHIQIHGSSVHVECLFFLKKILIERETVVNAYSFIVNPKNIT